MPFFYFAFMSARFFHSARLDELRDALTEETAPRRRNHLRLVKG